jgi:hypothetical protein
LARESIIGADPTAVSAGEYQRAAAEMLGRRFRDVRLEWSVVRDATDALSADINRYAPRVDIAVGPFNTSIGRDSHISEALLPRTLRALFDDRPRNPNPRCLLAIEIVYSGSSKHIMGDMLNAGALGLYGLVVGANTVMPKIRRIREYLDVLAHLEKTPWLFRNVAAVSTADFSSVMAGLVLRRSRSRSPTG